MMKEIDIKEIKRLLGIKGLEPYDYEKYKKINPNLTESMYRKMRISGQQSKIRMGLPYVDKYTGEVLEGYWPLQLIHSYS